jgi:hypothetical protein
LKLPKNDVVYRNANSSIFRIDSVYDGLTAPSDPNLQLVMWRVWKMASAVNGNAQTSALLETPHKSGSAGSYFIREPISERSIGD